ncbi:cobalt transporter ATP-binding subunit [Canicola haemoglobinophilus]|uniref:Cobalt transporter ATP-binding subunit n=1 Tax=Canicola haemoglobinophilus TaxID=733 RepID=A0AB38H8Y2_9PAST|nr:ATP-binding protein [Canicola haemoglobinophilus]STO55681.1 cobalt transporter ATP-binding subunit [Canicola haemoglobinophilus]STO68007.1 cobalt transporter ATP-binding subunit [Canicola haemoglobinophilus]
MLNKIKFKSGTHPTSQDSLEIELSPVTVFIGPNNSGKSQALIEIEKWITQGVKDFTKIIDSIEIKALNEVELEKELLQNIRITPSEGNMPYDKDHMIIGKYNDKKQIYLPNLNQQASNPNMVDREINVLAKVLAYYTIRLDGQNRLALINSQNAGDLQSSPINHLSKLFKNSTLMNKVRDIIFNSFKKYLVIDPTNLGYLRLRLSIERPLPSIEKSLEKKSIDFHNNALLVEDASDGVKAFIGIVISLIAGESKFILIDEPEAFLHPTLSYNLGKEITSLLDSNKRLFISTHSADFLMGCVQNNIGINIIRLTYDSHGSTARVLTQDKLKPLMQNPLLRSIGVFNALFYNAVIVTEADADRAFYQEINERLLQAGDSRGIEGCLFLNAQNKQTVWDIVKPLRELGIPAVGIVDIDVIKEGGENWNKLLNGIFIPNLSFESLRKDRETLYKAFKATNKDLKRDGGVNLLSGSDKEFCENVFDKLFEYGCAIVSVGEIEKWLPNLDIERGKSHWLKNIFEKMGDNPNSNDYIKPQDGDVWNFIGKISKWINDPNKKGIPK